MIRSCHRPGGRPARPDVGEGRRGRLPPVVRVCPGAGARSALLGGGGAGSYGAGLTSFLEARGERVVAAVAPWLLELPGVGADQRRQVLVSWSSAGRLRSEAAFAALAGTNPIPPPQAR